MYFFTNQSMKAIAAIILTFVLVFSSLTGCKDETTTNSNKITLIPDPRSGSEIAADEIKKIKEIIAYNLEDLRKKADENPNQVSLANLHLKDYFLITTLLDFAKKYPKLKIVYTDAVLYGGVSGIDVDTTKPLSEEIERAIEKKQVTAKEYLYLAKSRKPTKGYPQDAVDSSIKQAQLEYDLAMNRTVRTFGFIVEGTNQDIYEMAKQEVSKDYVRIAHKGRKVDGLYDAYFFEPFYGCEKDCPNRWK